MTLKELERLVGEARTMLDAHIGQAQADDVEITTLVGAEHFGQIADDEGDQMFALTDIKVELSLTGEDPKVWFE